MKVDAVELRRLRLPLASPFRTAHGTVRERDVLLVRVNDGWAECVAPNEPTYTSEHVDGAHHVLRHHLVPRLLDGVGVDGVRGHHMAKAALEMALLDARLRQAGSSLAEHLGVIRDRVPAGIALGIPDSLSALVEQAGRAVEQRYRRIKLKIEPGWDLEPVAAVRAELGDGFDLQVDGNGSYTMGDVEHLAKLDRFNLVLVEQPFPPDDLLAHAALANRMRTPVCLDESVTSPESAATALALGACSVVNVKAGRVGGIAAARRLHDLCLAARVPMWVGGMSETGIGRAANLALAALPGFTLTGDLSASARWYEQDITPPVAVDDEGMIAVPRAPVEVLVDVVDAHTTAIEVIEQP